LEYLLDIEFVRLGDDGSVYKTERGRVGLGRAVAEAVEKAL
jgi:hypothetical protein